MKRGSRESSPSVRRIVRMAWLSALSETTTSFQTRSKMSRRCTASCRRSIEKDQQIEVARDERPLAPARTSIRRRGERMKSLKR